MNLDKNQLRGGSSALIGVAISTIFGHSGGMIVGILTILIFLIYIVKAIKNGKKTTYCLW